MSSNSGCMVFGDVKQIGQTIDWKPAVFLDRDGTLIEDKGDLNSPAEVEFFEQTVPALQRLQEHFLLFIVTNQSGVAKGQMTLEQVHAVNQHVVDSLRENGVSITAVYVCPHLRADNCHCIKPKPYFLEQAVAEFGVDLLHSYSVGDHLHDVELAENAGGTGVYVLSGHGLKHWPEVYGRAVVRMHIGEAADWILEHAFQNRSPR